ncbi:CBS domain-containing protein [Saccharomonospora saliphila]|uniref:CBS domain-containing protein n=1 Tax=Saccharomonospora saliphila TaxID=369829 RepID=UPI00037C98C4|nr:CBS domain-containing protein [Saccharomonospora saliphila]
MTLVRDIMTQDPHCAETSMSVSEAARMMASAGVGALPVRGEDGELKGVLTDRDIVVKVLAEGKDPVAVHVGEVARSEVFSVAPDADVDSALRTMAGHRVRRLVVLDGDRLVGIVSQADVARSQSGDAVGRTVEEISKD